MCLVIMYGQNTRNGARPALFHISCYLCCSVYCLCVNVYCHQVTTQLQLINISYHIISYQETRLQIVHFVIGRVRQGVFDLWHSIQRVTVATCVHAIWFTHVTHARSAAFIKTIFTKFATVQQHCALISDAEFQLNRTTNVDGTGKKFNYDLSSV
jgi:hypothetical protein